MKSSPRVSPQAAPSPHSGPTSPSLPHTAGEPSMSTISVWLVAPPLASGQWNRIHASVATSSPSKRTFSRERAPPTSARFRTAMVTESSKKLSRVACFSSHLSCSLLHSALPSGASGKVLKGAETGSNQVVTYSRGSVISGPRVTPPRTAASASGSDFSVTLPWVAEGAGLAALAGPDDVVRTSIVSADVDCRPALMIAGTKNSATPTMATTAAAAIPRMRLLRHPPLILGGLSAGSHRARGRLRVVLWTRSGICLHGLPSPG